MSEETLQLWPGGQSVKIAGSSGVIDKVRFCDPGSGKYGRWHEPSVTELRRIRIEQIAERLFETDVLCCDSALVGALIALAGECAAIQEGDTLPSAFAYEEMDNIYPDPAEWNEGDCKEWLKDHGIDYPIAPQALGTDEDDYLDVLRDLVTNNADAAEVFEWWRVSARLLEDLRQIGEVVLDNDYGEWWGRTCTGQQLIMDGTLQKVAAAVLDR